LYCAFDNSVLLFVENLFVFNSTAAGTFDNFSTSFCNSSSRISCLIVEIVVAIKIKPIKDICLFLKRVDIILC